MNSETKARHARRDNKREDLVDEDSEEAERAGEAAVGPLHEEEEEAGGGAVGDAHLQARPVVVPRAVGRPAGRRTARRQHNNNSTRSHCAKLGEGRGRGAHRVLACWMSAWSTLSESLKDLRAEHAATISDCPPSPPPPPRKAAAKPQGSPRRRHHRRNLPTEPERSQNPREPRTATAPPLHRKPGTLASSSPFRRPPAASAVSIRCVRGGGGRPREKSSPTD